MIERKMLLVHVYKKKCDMIYLDANASIHIEGCKCVWAEPWQGLQALISNTNNTKQAAVFPSMKSVTDVISRGNFLIARRWLHDHTISP